MTCRVLCRKLTGWEMRRNREADHMAFHDMKNRQSVLQAMEEFDRLGREEFLRKYGFGPAREYVLVHEGKQYDSKAIVGAAHGYEYPAKGPYGQTSSVVETIPSGAS